MVAVELLQLMMPVLKQKQQYWLDLDLLGYHYGSARNPPHTAFEAAPPVSSAALQHRL